MNRCIYIKNNKQCRAKTKNNNLFCCKSHEPINNEIIKDGCFMCMELIEKSNEMLYFKCNHVFHKPCYLKWLEFSTYSDHICLICRQKKYNDNIKDNKKNIKKKIIDVSKIKNLYNILHK